MTFEEFAASVAENDAPSADLSNELKALWLTKKDRWDDAHEVVNDIHSSMGSWIHAHLHLIEGDIGNAGYWYSKAGKSARRDQAEIPAEWEEIVRANL
ncbi:MAG: hypothetical protein ACI8UO_000864 [Verrucomicrobiales bacterium]|jgi:hypothetical protein